MAFVNLVVTTQVELSTDEIMAIDRALTSYRETSGGQDPIINQLSSEIKSLIPRLATAQRSVDSALDGNSQLEQGVIS